MQVKVYSMQIRCHLSLAVCFRSPHAFAVHKNTHANTPSTGAALGCASLCASLRLRCWRSFLMGAFPPGRRSLRLLLICSLYWLIAWRRRAVAAGSYVSGCRPGPNAGPPRLAAPLSHGPVPTLNGGSPRPLLSIYPPALLSEQQGGNTVDYSRHACWFFGPLVV